MLPHKNGRNKVLKSIEQSGKEVIALCEAQISQFSGNAIELSCSNGRNIILSRTSYETLHEDQIESIAHCTHLQSVDVLTIEMAAGSIRCMIAAVYHKPKAIV